MKLQIITIIILVIAISVLVIAWPKGQKQEMSLCTIEDFYTIEDDGYSVAPYIQGECDHKKVLVKWCELNLANSEEACLKVK